MPPAASAELLHELCGWPSWAAAPAEGWSAQQRSEMDSTAPVSLPATTATGVDLRLCTVCESRGESAIECPRCPQPVEVVAAAGALEAKALSGPLSPPSPADAAWHTGTHWKRVGSLLRRHLVLSGAGQVLSNRTPHPNKHKTPGPAPRTPAQQRARSGSRPHGQAHPGAVRKRHPGGRVWQPGGKAVSVATPRQRGRLASDRMASPVLGNAVPELAMREQQSQNAAVNTEHSNARRMSGAAAPCCSCCDSIMHRNSTDEGPV